MAKKRKRSSSTGSQPPEPPSHNRRETRLNQEVQDQIIGYLLEGNYFSVACRLAGIPESTGKEWLYRGRGTDRDRAQTELYASFASAVKEAQCHAERNMVNQIREAAVGRQVFRSKVVTKRYRDRDGNEVEETTNERVESTDRDWTAAAWMLERSHPERWGRQRMAELEAWKVLIEAGQVPAAVIDALLAGEEERRSRIQAALSTPENDPSILG